MTVLLTVIASLKSFVKKETCFDDFIDEIHHSLTFGLLICLAILVSFKQFGGKPMECMVPMEWSSSWEDYAENYCWSENTYWLPVNDLVPQNIEEREEREIAYYQWVPFFLVFMAGCFKLPSFVWKMASTHSGIRVHKILTEAVDPKNLDFNARSETIQFLTCHLSNALKFHRRLERRAIVPYRIFRCFNLPYTAFYVTFMYFLTKVLYLLNIIIQFLLLNKFMETSNKNDTSLYGFGLLADIINGTTWDVSGKFPRITLCDIQVREMANLQRNTFQCMLVINLFNEKIFIFLWFYFMVLGSVTLLSSIYWAIVLLIPVFHRWFVARHLELSEMPFDPSTSKRDVERFVKSYMKSDGMFILRMITAHTGVIFGTELTVSLWRSFYGVEVVREQSDGGTSHPITAPAIMIPPPTYAPKKSPYLEDLCAVPELLMGPERLATVPLNVVDRSSLNTASDVYVSCKTTPDISAIRQEKFLQESA